MIRTAPSLITQRTRHAPRRHGYCAGLSANGQCPSPLIDCYLDGTSTSMFCAAERNTTNGTRLQVFGVGDSCITDTQFSGQASARAFTSTHLFRAFDRAGRGRERWCLGSTSDLSAGFIFRPENSSVNCLRSGAWFFSCLSLQSPLPAQQQTVLHA